MEQEVKWFILIVTDDSNKVTRILVILMLVSPYLNYSNAVPLSNYKAETTFLAQGKHELLVYSFL